ncbi:MULTISPECIES: DsrE family protein [unclassified Leeuwenhoekiella]|uniref:DsrE family protein n=1 Tax=unclassified Leeuwenhoekiella TaxID=2615029 RepID=UPI000C5A0348|nr:MULTISPECIES: DsrE family protein [unclassified Leeuwenhoekiella]MAW93796.1 hypothetical protein [Leeuwenhoekiella sp.]MBA80570.1 hypothetical protein [Leeuwenhoekiella sp.]|tara:strand:- start:5117 stop:5662 length:546 start_codon:yes stop_codon:yes gene_type:complete
MILKTSFTLIFLFFAFAKTTQAQELISGPLIEGFGETFTVPEADLPADPEKIYRVVFDIAQAPEDPAEVNLYFNTVARFINMHAAAGVPVENLKPVLVVHGSAAFDLLKNEFYREKFGVDNPNLPLLEAFHKLDVPMILCGQTAGKRDIPKEKRWEHTQIALSAMTALIHYQNLGYALISF